MIASDAANMTENVTYDDVFERYENAKHLLREITTTFNSSFSNVQNVIIKYQNEANGEFVGELSSVLSATKNSLETLFKSTEDPGLYEATKLEQQIASFQVEKKNGLEMVKGLQSKIESLEEEKRNWLIREQKGKKLIEQYQAQLEQKNGTYLENNNNDKPKINGTTTDYDNDTNVVQELTDELELAQTSAGDMRKMVDSLSTENKSLSNQVLTLREQVATLTKKQLQHKNGTYSKATSSQYGPSNVDSLKQQISQLISEKDRLNDEVGTYKRRLTETGVNDKHLYRSDTKTDWNMNEMDLIKEEMRQELLSQHQAALNAQFEKSWELRAPQLGDNVESINENKEEQYDENTDVLAKNNDDEDGGNNNNRESKRIDRAFRDGTVTDWDPEALHELKAMMKQDLQKMLMEDKQKKLMAFEDRGDAIRDVKDQSTSELIEPNAYDYNDIDQQAKRLEIAEREKKEKEMEQQNQREMQEEMRRLKMAKIAAQTDKNYNLVTASTADVNSMSAVQTANDRKEMEQQMIALKKQQILERTSMVNTTEPQIKPNHKTEFDALMKSIGILNESQKNAIWTNIDDIVNGDKLIPFEKQNTMGHGITRSQLMDRDEIEAEVEFNEFKTEIDENAVNELKTELQRKNEELAEIASQLQSQQRYTNELQEELENLKQQQEDQDAMGILKSDVETPQHPPVQYIDEMNGDGNGDNVFYETPIGPDPNQIALESADNKNNEDKIVKLQRDVETLKQEKINLKSHYDEELKQVQQEIDRLNDDVKSITLSKIKLLENTSKEIDSLRELLSEYVRIANAQKRKK